MAGIQKANKVGYSKDRDGKVYGSQTLNNLVLHTKEFGFTLYLGNEKAFCQRSGMIELALENLLS